MFAHWPVSAEALQALLPPGLEIETFEGQAYFALVPFMMSNVKLRGLPPIPTAHSFLEMNMRTYARHVDSGKTGVWFISLDSNSELSNWAARMSFHLRYLKAQMSINVSSNQVQYSSNRLAVGGDYTPYPTFLGPRAKVEVAYQPNGAENQYGPLVEFLTSRYRLFSYSRRGQLYAAEIDHEPWKLKIAKATFSHLDITGGLGIALKGDPLLLYSEHIDVCGWKPYSL